jgi:hypothetical protein
VLLLFCPLTALVIGQVIAGSQGQKKLRKDLLTSTGSRAGNVHAISSRHHARVSLRWPATLARNTSDGIIVVADDDGVDQA